MLWKKLVPQPGDCQVSVKRQNIENKNSQFPGICTYIITEIKMTFTGSWYVYFIRKMYRCMYIFFVFVSAYYRDISPKRWVYMILAPLVPSNRCRSSVKRRCWSLKAKNWGVSFWGGLIINARCSNSYLSGAMLVYLLTWTGLTLR